jgi:hypothetical protein
MSQTERRSQPDSAEKPAFESAPWAVREVVVEEPQQAPHDAPLVLAQDDHVVDVALDGEAILRTR